MSYWERHAERLLKQMGASKVSPRPQHPRSDKADQETFKKNFPVTVAEAFPEHARDKSLEYWWQDEARIDQHGHFTRVWAEKGTRPRAPEDKRFSCVYIFGAVCLERDIGAALIEPYANTDAMNRHLEEIALHVADDAHAVLIMDQGACHTGTKLRVPDNLTLIPLPPRCPELNPVENIWQFMRENWLSNRIFASYENIVLHCCEAWNQLIDLPWTIMSIACRQWAYEW